MAGFADEGRALARYLTGREPAPILLSRYERVCAADASPRGRRSTLNWATRLPWLLPALDAGAAWLDRRSLLRRRLLLMTALIETNPPDAGLFLPAPTSPAFAVVRLAADGVRFAGASIVGVPLTVLSLMERA